MDMDGLFSFIWFGFLYPLGLKVYKVVIHDQLVPSIAFYPSREEILSWIEY